MGEDFYKFTYVPSSNITEVKQDYKMKLFSHLLHM